MFRASLCPSTGDPNAFHCLTGNIHYTMHTSCHPTLHHHNSYNRTDNYRQWNAVGSPDDGRKDARNMLRYYLLPVNHYLLHLVGLSFTYLQICYLTEFVLEWEIFHTRIFYKIKKSFCIQYCFRTSLCLGDNVEEYGRFRQATDQSKGHAHCMLDN
jgi:hypothetical protein